MKKISDIINEAEFAGYDNLWIEALLSSEGNVDVDKKKNVQPIYGGGSFTFVGYKVNSALGPYSSFILEGLQINGCFAQAAVIGFMNEQAMTHGALDFTYHFKDTVETNITNVKNALESWAIKHGK